MINNICKHCGSDTGSKRAKYCSNNCKVTAWRKRTNNGKAKLMNTVLSADTKLVIRVKYDNAGKQRLFVSTYDNGKLVSGPTLVAAISMETYNANGGFVRSLDKETE